MEVDYKFILNKNNTLDQINFKRIDDNEHRYFNGCAHFQDSVRVYFIAPSHRVLRKMH